MTTVNEHLSLVFHRFIESKKIKLFTNTYEIWKIKELEINLDENDESSLINSLN
jgi:hypothetical protein